MLDVLIFCIGILSYCIGSLLYNILKCCGYPIIVVKLETKKVVAVVKIAVDHCAITLDFSYIFFLFLIIFYLSE